MPSPAGQPPALKVYLYLNAAALTAAAGLMIVIGRGSLSALRLFLTGGTLLAALLFAAAAIRLQLRPATDQALRQAIFETPLRKRLVPIFGIAFPIFWSLIWLPPAYARDPYHSYFIGLYPLFLCGTIACGAALVLLLSSRVESTGAALADYWRAHRTALYVTLAVLGGFAFVALLTPALKVLSGREPYWYGAGVPILASQVFLATLITVIVLHLQARPLRVRLPVDLVLFILIWGVTAALWASRPVPDSYWVTAPRPPNHENYPFSDLVTFDVASQFALIGQGINNHVFFDRALYIAFLVYLHSLAGQNYQQLMTVQAVLFAAFPALLYLIGKRMQGRPAGILIAALSTMRGLNSLTAASWIDTSTFKHMLTDFPTAIALAILVLLLLKWLEAPAQKGHYLLWMGGLLGLTSLMRPHVLLLFAPILLLAGWLYRSRWRQAFVLGALTVAAGIAAVTPWPILSQGAASFFALYGKRIQDVMAQRYPGIVPVQPQATAVLAATAIPGTEATEVAPPTALPTAVPSGLPPPVAPPASSGIPFQVTHYLHNLDTAALIFPVSPEFLSVRDTVKGGEPIWEPRWDGSMSLTAASMLVLALVAVAFGIGTSVQRMGWRGYAPLGVLLVYYVANALARTSGGRYLVPVDWILVAYFGLGIAELLQLGGGLVGATAPAIVPAATDSDSGMRMPSAISGVAILGSVVLLGALIPLAGVLYPPRYPPRAASAILEEIQPSLSKLGLTPVDVSTFMAQPGAVLLEGRVLYPRYYAQGTGEPVRYLPYRQTNYPRTVFIFIGPAGQPYSILPGPVPRVFPNVSDAIVLGCRGFEEGYDMLRAVAVVLPERGVAYARSPRAELTCPQPVPVCDSNGNCR